jgi:hypothetical protein
MNDDDLDRILSRQEDIVPSSGFVSNVMDAVRREASAPPPIPFPWKWAIPGLRSARSGSPWHWLYGSLQSHLPCVSPDQEPEISRIS